MPNVPAQFPNIDLPGAEYFSLAPNASVALQGRRRIHFASTPTSAPTVTNNNNNAILGVPLEFTFTGTSGIYLHYFYIVQTVTAPGLTLNNVAAGLTTGAANGPTYFLGSPSLTTPVLNLSTVVLLDRDRLITQKDVAAADQGFGVAVGPNLFLAAQLNVNNQTAGAISFGIIGLIIYTRLDGLTE